jgi:hypothetical protein
MSDEPGAAGEQQRELLSRLRAAVDAKDAENAVLRQELDAERELRRRLELRIAELERRLGMDSSDSGTPSLKERIGVKEARRARRQESERERRKDRRRPVTGGAVRGSRRAVGLASEGRGESCRPATAGPRVNPGRLRPVTPAAHLPRLLGSVLAVRGQDDQAWRAEGAPLKPLVEKVVTASEETSEETSCAVPLEPAYMGSA